ncbi:MAG: trigger factor [Magnetococcales bacterium]|nr:trigger factor [Magnetococcales bacterium]
MEVTLEEKGGFDRSLTIQVPASQVDTLLDGELAQLATTAKLPGFRPGKVPKKVLESRYRKELSGTVAEKIFKTTYSQALQEKAVFPATAPMLDMGDVARGQDFTYTVLFQVLPEVDPQGYKGVDLVRPEATIGDAEVDQVVEEIRTRNAKFEAQEGREAQSGDQVELDFKGFLGETAFEGGTADNYVLELGSGQFIPGFEEQLIGAKPGEDREVTVSFPEAYGNAELAGKEALFKCHIHEVRARLLPEIDDKLAELAGVKEGGVSAMRMEVNARLEKEAAEAVERDVKRQILDKLLEANPMELPDQVVERELDGMVKQTQEEYQRQGMDPAQMGLSEDKMRESLVGRAQERVKLGLLIGTIGQKEALKVEEAEVEAHLETLVAPYGAEAAAMKSWLKKDNARMEDLRGAVLEKKVMDWIVDNGSVVKEERTFKELVQRSGQ